MARNKNTTLVATLLRKKIIENDMKKLLLTPVLILCMLYAHAFCGFYVAKAGAELFNNTSQVIIVRDGNKSVITMSNDFSGNVADFAMVIPVPQVLQRDQIRLSSAELFGKLDAYSGPRLVEYYDQNPCNPVIQREMKSMQNSAPPMLEIVEDSPEEDKDYGVTIEAQYAVGEYDILILSAKESDGLKTWLTSNGYKIPEKAARVLEPYIKSKMKFFVVKVNLEAHQIQGNQQLKPLQIEFESEKFMLPIRLGMANSKGEQDMVVYALTRTGRVETANYRTLEIPSNRNIPTFVKEKFGQFYTDLFEKTHQLAGKNTVFVEYAWNVSPTWGGMKCDPCVGPPPIYADLANAGVWWLNETQAKEVFFTRLHVRYSEDKFPEDLFFIATPNKTQFQGRYILTHPAGGDLSCDAGSTYQRELNHRRNKELSELSALAGWNTSKYTRYVESGSNYIDEKRNSTPIIVPGNKSPGAGGGILFVGLVLFGLLSIIYLLDLRKNKVAMS
ncbi:MAG: hypothetical protein ACI8ZN_001571 [Bacteroidia bacterium]|jgi:hypothetical protein